MSTSTTIIKREYWYTQNISSKTISLGDLPDIPTFGPGSNYDLLEYYDKGTILQSKALLSVMQEGWLQITTRIDGVSTPLDPSGFPGNLVDSVSTSAANNWTATQTFAPASGPAIVAQGDVHAGDGTHHVDSQGVVRIFGLGTVNPDGSLPTNFELLSVGWDGTSVYNLQTEAGGSGVVRNLSLNGVTISPAGDLTAPSLTLDGSTITSWPSGNSSSGGANALQVDDGSGGFAGSNNATLTNGIHGATLNLYQTGVDGQVSIHMSRTDVSGRTLDMYADDGGGQGGIVAGNSLNIAAGSGHLIALNNDVAVAGKVSFVAADTSISNPSNNGRLRFSAAGTSMMGARSDGLYLSNLILDGVDGTATTNISKLGAGSIGFGNGTAGDTSAAVSCGSLSAASGNFMVDGSNGNVTCNDLRPTAYIRSVYGLQIANKAQSGWLSVLTRNTTGSEAAFDLSNIGSLSAASGDFVVDGSNGNISGNALFASDLFIASIHGNGGILVMTPNNDGSATFNGPVTLKSYTVATLPTPGTAGRSAFATNASYGGGTGAPVYDYGTNWCTPDGAIAHT